MNAVLEELFRMLEVSLAVVLAVYCHVGLVSVYVDAVPTTSSTSTVLPPSGNITTSTSAVGKPWLKKAMIAFVIVGFMVITLLVFFLCRCIRQSIKQEDRRAGLLTNPDTLSESQFKKLQRQSAMLFGRKKREQARQELEGLVQVPLVDAIETQTAQTFGRILTRPQLTIPAMDGETYNNTVTAHRSFLRRASVPATTVDTFTLNSNGSCDRLVSRQSKSTRTVQIQAGDPEPVQVVNNFEVDGDCHNNKHVTLAQEIVGKTVKGKTKTFTVSTPAEPNIPSNLIVRVRNQSVQTACAEEPRSLRRQSEPARPALRGEVYNELNTLREVCTPTANLAAGDTHPLLQPAAPCDPDVLRCADNKSDVSSDTGIGYSVDDRASPDSRETTCL